MPVQTAVLSGLGGIKKAINDFVVEFVGVYQSILIVNK